MLKDIPGFPGYKISPEGEIFSTISNKYMSTKNLSSGYPYITLNTAGSSRTNIPVHRLLALTFIANPNNLPEVNHKDGDKLNNSLNNLEWVSSSGNIRHAFESNLTTKKAAIPYEDIPEIVSRLISENITWSDLAREYGVTDPSTIRKLIKRDFYRRGEDLSFTSLTALVKQRAQDNQKTPVELISPSGEIIKASSFHEAAAIIGAPSPASIWKALSKSRTYRGYTFRRA